MNSRRVVVSLQAVHVEIVEGGRLPVLHDLDRRVTDGLRQEGPRPAAKRLPVLHHAGEHDRPVGGVGPLDELPRRQVLNTRNPASGRVEAPRLQPDAALPLEPCNAGHEVAELLGVRAGLEAAEGTP